MLLVRWMCLILFVTRCFTRIQHHTYQVKTTESPSVQGLRPQGETGPKSFTRCNLGVVTKPPYCWRCKRRGHWHSVQTITLKYLFFCRCQCIKIEKQWSARTCRDLPGPSSEKIKYQSSKLLFFFNSWAMKKKKSLREECCGNQSVCKDDPSVHNVSTFAPTVGAQTV